MRARKNPEVGRAAGPEAGRCKTTGTPTGGLPGEGAQQQQARVAPVRQTEFRHVTPLYISYAPPEVAPGSSPAIALLRHVGSSATAQPRPGRLDGADARRRQSCHLR